MTEQARVALAVADWRRQVFASYARVRDAAVPADAHQRWVQDRDGLFAEHPASPLPPAERATFRGLPVAPYDPAWRFTAEIEPAPLRRLKVPTGTDGTVPFERIGRVRVGDLGTLDVWRLASYGGGIFLPIKDASAGRTGGSYGGGRYLLDTVKGADLGSEADGTGIRIVVDFNFAYNPSCAYDPAWACPLAPPGNTIEVEVPVGERQLPTVR